jgi:hypothetical protein
MSQLFSLLLNGAPPAASRALLASDDRIDPAFKPTYDREIVPHLVTFEQKRVEALHSLRMRAFVGVPAIAAVIAAGVYVLTQLEGKKDGLAELTLMVCLGIGAWMYRRVTLYHGDVKSQVFPTVFRHFGDFIYSPKADFTFDAWQQAGIVPKYTVSQSTLEDSVIGTHRGVSLKIVEAKLIKGQGKNRSTVFKGLIAKVGVGKRFKGTTIIRRDKGRLGNTFSSLGRGKLETVRLEDPTFEARYEVCSTDQVEARYLLTTSFMERLMELEDKLDSKIEAAFNDQQLLIMISSSRNWFEPSSIYEPATFVEDISLIFDQMHALFQIIEILKLDENTGL